jgi:hypothetical protein
MKLKIPLRRNKGKCRRKFEILSVIPVHCFPRYRPVRLVLHRHVGFRLRLAGNGGYSVSELTTRTFISGGAKLLLKQIRRVKKDQRSRAGRRMFACV